jgi:hypothetical protein
MGDNFLLKFSKLKNKTASNFSSTLPLNECNNGFPISKYSGYGVNAWEVLYSIWVANQTTLGATFTYNQAVNNAPTTSPTNGPSNIFIIRHGEKNQTINYNINNNGAYRACQLISFVNQLASNGTPISYIISCNPCPYNTSDPSMRPVQTISMVSFMLNIPIFIFGGSQDYNEIVSNIFSSGIFDGLNVLICWEHGAIQQLCLNLLDEAGNLGRLSPGITTGDQFFTSKNLCPDGKFLCTSSSVPSNPAFVPPIPGTILGVGSNTQNYPYWNNNNFDNVYWLKSNSITNYIFDFSIFKQPCQTCYQNCNLNIGLYQPLPQDCTTTSLYTTSATKIEDSCIPPSTWSV